MLVDSALGDRQLPDIGYGRPMGMIMGLVWFSHHYKGNFFAVFSYSVSLSEKKSSLV